MLKRIAILLCCAVAISCGQNTGNQNQNGNAGVNKSKPHYRLMSGQLGDQAITMNLVQSGSSDFTGWYYYDQIGEPIQFWGQTDTSGFIILREETFDGSENPYFRGNLGEEGQFEGIWVHPEKSQETPFKLKTGSDQKSVVFDVAYLADSVKLLPKIKNSPTGHVTATIVWPKSGADQETLRLIRSAITSGHSDRNFSDGKAFAGFLVEEFKSGYKSDLNASELEEMTGSAGAAMAFNYVQETRMSVPWNKWPLLAIETYVYAYTGGAHGNHGSSFQMFDLEKKKELKPEDLFLPGYKPLVDKALEKALRRKYDIAENESLKDNLLFEEHVESGNNFYFTDKGVIFSFTPYEIASFAAGQISAFIPFEEIKPVVRPEYLPK